ncbi:MAG: hypothetical protein EZS28_007355 [Streblomastix strix]|uniref:Uncharacterized protein n=1 Tax=Streblomastix strix TaxID=222440 RepID=A0A5J4WQE4_9EUKA|nr:MAG: hypothetical protein EZS28_007355 [Streblomastix strix]
MNQFYTSPNHSKQVVAQALHLLSTIINNDRNRSKLAIQVPGLVVSLTKLVQFDQKHYLRYMSNRDSRQILISGFKSLGSICLYSDYFTVRRLIREWRFPQILAELTTSKGQEDEIWKEMLKNSLHYFTHYGISNPSTQKDKSSSSKQQNPLDLLIKYYLSEFNRILTELKLPHFQRLFVLIIEAEAWSVKNGVLSPTQKLKRFMLKFSYEKELEGMMDALGNTEK